MPKADSTLFFNICASLIANLKSGVASCRNSALAIRCGVMSGKDASGDLPFDCLRPTWGRMAAAVLVAVAAFLIPQGVPLEWYPLNNPGKDIDYLEITCASDRSGEITIYYDTTHGINEFDSIRFPISPSVRCYTYTFPLPDAPIVSLRLRPVANGATLTVSKLAVVNRRGDLIFQVTREMLGKSDEIGSILPHPEGWMITSVPGAQRPMVLVTVPHPIVPLGMNMRNLHRCILSTGYLAGMLLILLSAVLFSFWRPQSWRDFWPRIAFLFILALLFSFVGNRGLIWNSIRYLNFEVPTAMKG